MEVGNKSPRAFFDHDKDAPPNAAYFQEILENSLTSEEITNFCNDFLRLFEFQKKSHKQKVNQFRKLILNLKQSKFMA